MRHFYIKTQGVVPERSILLICLVPGDWRKLMFEGLPNIAGPGQAVDHTCIRFCPSDAEADRFIAHMDAGGLVDDFPGREVSAEIVRAAAAEDPLRRVKG